MGHVKRLLLAVYVPVVGASLEYLLGRALDERQVVVACHLGRGVLIRGVERDITDRLHVRGTLSACRKTEYSALGGVAADNLHVLALAGNDGERVLMDRQRQDILQLSADVAELLGFVESAVDERYRLELTLGDGAGLIGEQDIQGACGLDTCDLSYKHIVLEHLAHVLRGNYRDHQRKSLGDSHYDDDDRKHYRLDNSLEQSRPLENSLCEQERFDAALAHEQRLYEHRDRDSDTADVAELAYAVSQLAELHLERSLAVVVGLEFACDLAVYGLVADYGDFHYRVAGTYHASAEHLVLVVEIEALVGILPALGNCELLSLAALAVEHGLICLDIAVDDDTVSRNLISGL